jgi:hypothetical protein
MCRRVILLSLVSLCLSLAAWSATAPPPVPAALPQPAVAAPPSGSPAWLLPAPNASLEKPGSQAPLGALWADACSSACLQAETQCFDCCNGDHACNVSCSNDYYCCLQTCNPSGPQCN